MGGRFRITTGLLDIIWQSSTRHNSQKMSSSNPTETTMNQKLRILAMAQFLSMRHL